MRLRGERSVRGSAVYVGREKGKVKRKGGMAEDESRLDAKEERRDRMVR